MEVLLIAIPFKSFLDPLLVGKDLDPLRETQECGLIHSADGCLGGLFIFEVDECNALGLMSVLVDHYHAREDESQWFESLDKVCLQDSGV